MAANFPQTDFDESCLAGLEDALSRAEFERLLTDYLASATRRLAQIKALGDRGDLQELALAAHTLISTSGSYGLARASALARALEQACNAGRADEVSALLPMIVDSTACGCAALRARFLGDGVAAP